MIENRKVIEILEKLLDISNSLLNDYCDVYDEYVLSNEEIEMKEDEEERERAIDLKETNDFLYEVGAFIQEYKNEYKIEESCEEEII